jgi:hypothetical protein
MYAFAIAMTRDTDVGGIPAPVHAPPAVALDDVTKGYVPWSTSSSVAWPPSSSTTSSRSSAWPSSSAVSVT